MRSMGNVHAEGFMLLCGHDMFHKSVKCFNGTEKGRITGLDHDCGFPLALLRVLQVPTVAFQRVVSDL